MKTKNITNTLINTIKNCQLQFEINDKLVKINYSFDSGKGEVLDWEYDDDFEPHILNSEEVDYIYDNFEDLIK